MKEHFIFTIKDNAKILTIASCEQLKRLPKQIDETTRIVRSVIDFEGLAEEYDAIEVLITEDNKLYYEMYGWDCDCIVITNPDIIVIE